jgi:hypothetical protein
MVEIGRHAWLRAMWDYPVRVQVPLWADNYLSPVFFKKLFEEIILPAGDLFVK